jgi:hypothetical protein
MRPPRSTWLVRLRWPPSQASHPAGPKATAFSAASRRKPVRNAGYHRSAYQGIRVSGAACAKVAVRWCNYFAESANLENAGPGLVIARRPLTGDRRSNPFRPSRLLRGAHAERSEVLAVMKDGPRVTEARRPLLQHSITPLLPGPGPMGWWRSPTRLLNVAELPQHDQLVLVQTLNPQGTGWRCGRAETPPPARQLIAKRTQRLRF